MATSSVPDPASLVAALTYEPSGRRTARLAEHVGVLVLTHTVRALNEWEARGLEELIARRESAALLARLRFYVQRDANRRQPVSGAC